MFHRAEDLNLPFLSLQLATRSFINSLFFCNPQNNHIRIIYTFIRISEYICKIEIKTCDRHLIGFVPLTGVNYKVIRDIIRDHNMLAQAYIIQCVQAQAHIRKAYIIRRTSRYAGRFYRLISDASLDDNHDIACH